MPRPYRTSLTPAEMSEKARNAALARTTTEAHIKALVDRAPELTDDQRAKLRTLLVTP